MLELLIEGFEVEVIAGILDKPVHSIMRIVRNLQLKQDVPPTQTNNAPFYHHRQSSIINCPRLLEWTKQQIVEKQVFKSASEFKQRVETELDLKMSDTTA